jgi:hypothetical protein
MVMLWKAILKDLGCSEGGIYTSLLDFRRVTAVQHDGLASPLTHKGGVPYTPGHLKQVLHLTSVVACSIQVAGPTPKHSVELGHQFGLAHRCPSSTLEVYTGEVLSCSD